MIKRRFQFKVRATIKAQSEEEFWQTLEAVKRALQGLGKPLPGETALQKCTEWDATTDAFLSEEITAD